MTDLQQLEALSAGCKILTQARRQLAANDYPTTAWSVVNHAIVYLDDQVRTILLAESEEELFTQLACADCNADFRTGGRL